MITLFYNFTVNFARKFRPSSLKSCTLQLNPSLNPCRESVIFIYEDSLTSNSCKCIDEKERERGGLFQFTIGTWKVCLIVCE